MSSQSNKPRRTRQLTGPLPSLSRPMQVALGALSLVGILGATSDAAASGFSVARFGGEHGTPMTTNGTSLYYNPAGFAASDGTHLLIDITAAWRSTSYQHTVAPTDSSEAGGTDADLAREANTDEGTLFNVIPSPSAFVTTKFDDFGLALGFFTPFGGAAKWDKNDDLKDDPKYQGLSDGGQRWYTIDGQLRISYLSLGAGYHLADTGLSFGLAANLLVNSVKTLRARTASGNDDIVREGRTYLDVSSLDWSIGLGVRYATPDDKVVVGASWQSAPHLSGDMRMSGTLTNVYGPEDALAGGTTGDTDFTMDLPNVFRAGVEFDVNDNIRARLFGDYQTWSATTDHCVVSPGGTCDIQPDGTDANGETTVNQPRNWKNTWGIRGGASYFLDPDNGGPELFAGMGYASNAIDGTYLEPALVDFHAFTPVVGARFEISKSLGLATSYTQVFYISRETSSSVLALKQAPSRGPNTNGKYSQSIGVLNINADYKF